MEIQTQTVTMKMQKWFKIDLIVWKQNTSKIHQNMNIKFKIDLIVWKSTECIKSRRRELSLKQT